MLTTIYRIDINNYHSLTSPSDLLRPLNSVEEFLLTFAAPHLFSLACRSSSYLPHSTYTCCTLISHHIPPHWAWTIPSMCTVVNGLLTNSLCTFYPVTVKCNPTSQQCLWYQFDAVKTIFTVFAVRKRALSGKLH